MRFGFLAHATTDGQRNQFRAAVMLADLYAERRGAPPEAVTTAELPIFGRVRSVTGARCTGEVRALPYTAAQLLGNSTRTEGIVLAAARTLVKNGATVIGLGGATAIVGGRGLHLAQTLPVSVTTGNSLTVHAAHDLVQQVVTRLDLPAAAPIAIVGYPGSIGLALARLLLAGDHRLALVHRRAAAASRFLLEHLPGGCHEQVSLHRSVADCVEACAVIIGASSTGGLIDPAALLPGTVVVDVALPRDVREGARRDDILVLDGGLVRAVDEVHIDPGVVPAPRALINGCLAETIVLALDGGTRSFSLGRVLEPDAVQEMGALAARHGFPTAHPTSFGRPVDLAVLDRFRRRRPTTRDRFRRHVNPGLHDLFAAHGLDQTFVHASGCTLTTADGTEYLDLVAGYGSLNVGHNHPHVVDRLRRHLDLGAPTFAQYVSMPVQCAALAERLADLAPGGLDRVFFSNSGTEAVEAAIKLARAATGRDRLVHAAGSYHGKTLGALSITGRRHRTAFGELLPGCTEVPYGDTAALATAVEGAAAFVVEPVQGENGVVVPPPGYLREAERLCRRAGALFVVDEVQTGLGRTGTLFASERDELRPDVLCLAKSLSGGLVPIGATVATTAVWDAAYGTASRSLLHTSTFGGGNFAAAAGLATLDVLTEPGFLDRARTTGDRLRRDLSRVCAPYDFVSEVRGVGMMNAVAFDGAFDGAVGSLADDLVDRLPGDLRALADTLPDDVVTRLRAAAAGVESALGDLLCLRVVATLREHRILSFVTASNNRVLRVQPPLVLTDTEADRFVEAMDQVCARFAALAGPSDRIDRSVDHTPHERMEMIPHVTG
ncbi:MAG: aminotransferase class III-fold pyridoxal phosphate-dependent enzyme [Pseudonocardia sp.]